MGEFSLIKWIDSSSIVPTENSIFRYNILRLLKIGCCCILGELRWKQSIIQGKSKDELGNIFELYQNGYLEKVKLTDDDPDLIDLTNMLLAYSSEKRLNAETASKQRYFN